MIDTKALLKRFSRLSRKDRLHILGRIKACPWQSILEQLPSGKVLIDIGCGHGVFINLVDMTTNGFERLIGVDLAANKIEVAKRTENKRVAFSLADWRELDETADIYSIIDVMYLVPFEEQEALIKYIHAHLPPGGYFLLKEMDKKPVWKYAFNYVEESIMVKLLGFTLGSRFYFRSREDLFSLLERVGFKVKAVSLDKGYLHPHLLFICQK